MTTSIKTHKPQKSLARLVRQLAFVPCLHNRWLTDSLKDKLSQRIGQAEQGHQGEIVLIIENQLPIDHAYHGDSYSRALDLFGLYRVWDTQENTGILAYVNLCQHDLHIIADRGIDQQVAQDTWERLCQNALSAFKQKQFETGLLTLIDELGQVLQTHYPAPDTHGNELPNQVVFLK